MSEPQRGDIWWGEAPDAKGRPYLVLTRSEAVPWLRTVLVAPVTRTVRSIPSEVPLGPEEGLPAACAANLDAALSFPKVMLVRRMGALAAARQHDPCRALAAATDC